MPGPGVTLLDPELAPAPQPVLVLLSEAALAVCWSCSRPQSQQEQSCFPVAGVPAACLWARLLSELQPRASRNVDVCDCPFLSSGVMSCYPARLSPGPLLQLN